MQYVSPVSGLKLGVALTNFSGNMKFEGSKLERRVVLPGTETGAVPTSVSIPTMKFEMPSQLKIGASYLLNFGDNLGLDLMGTFVNNSYAFDQYILGGELNFMDMFFLRASYALAYKEGLDDQNTGFVSANEDFLFGPAFGLGLKLGSGVPIYLDYAYQVTEFFESAQWFSLAVGF